MRYELSQLMFKITATIFYKKFNNTFQQAEYLFFLYDSLIIFISLSPELDSLFNINQIIANIERSNTQIQSIEDLIENNNNDKNLSTTPKSSNNYKEHFMNKSLFLISIIIHKTSVLVLKNDSINFIIKFSLNSLIIYSEEIHNNKETLQQIIKEAEYGLNYYIKTNTETQASIVNNTSNNNNNIEERKKSIELIKKFNLGLDTLCKFFIRFTPDLSSGKLHFNIIRDYLKESIINEEIRSSCLNYIMVYVYSYDFNNINYSYIHYSDTEKKEGFEEHVNFMNNYSCDANVVKCFKNILNILYNEDYYSNIDNKDRVEKNVIVEDKNDAKNNIDNKENDIISNLKASTSISPNRNSSDNNNINNNHENRNYYLDDEFNTINEDKDNLTEYSMAIKKEDIKDVNESLGIKFSEELKLRKDSTTSNIIKTINTINNKNQSDIRLSERSNNAIRNNNNKNSNTYLSERNINSNNSNNNNIIQSNSNSYRKNEISNKNLEVLKNIENVGLEFKINKNDDEDKFTNEMNNFIKNN